MQSDLAKTLAELSAKATQGEWDALKGVEKSDEMRCGITTKRGDYDYLLVTIENGAPGDFCDTEFDNAQFITTLVNAFRIGKLIVVDDGAVERMARAIQRRDQLRLSGFLPCALPPCHSP